MLFNRIRISSILSSLAVLSAGIALSACFEIPSKPNEGSSVNVISIYVKQDGKIDSTLLKIHPQDSAEILVNILPAALAPKLHFKWIRINEENDDILLGTGDTFKIRKNATIGIIPNKLIAIDTEGNTLVTHFNIITNTPPEIDQITRPQQSDTLYGNQKTSFLFEWNSHDNDNEEFSHTILIDKVPYVVGEFNSIRQSGFEEGKHTFQVIVTDKYGDTDSSAVIKFYVKSK